MHTITNNAKYNNTHANKQNINKQINAKSVTVHAIMKSRKRLFGTQQRISFLTQQMQKCDNIYTTNTKLQQTNRNQ